MVGGLIPSRWAPLREDHFYLIFPPPIDGPGNPEYPDLPIRSPQVHEKLSHLKLHRGLDILECTTTLEQPGLRKLSIFVVRRAMLVSYLNRTDVVLL